MHLVNLVKRFVREEDGAAAIEYALIAALIAIAIVTGATALGGAMDGFFSSLGTYIDGLASGI